MKLLLLLLCSLFLSACSEDEVTAEVLMTQAAPPELYRTFLVEPDKITIEGVLKSDQLWEELADAGVDDSRGKVRLEFFPEKRVIKVIGKDQKITNLVAETVITYFNRSDRAKRKALKASIEDLEIAQSDRVQDARRKVSEFVTPKMWVHPPVKRSATSQSLFAHTTDLLIEEVEREQKILNQLRSSHQRLRLLLKISYEPAVILQKAR